MAPPPTRPTVIASLGRRALRRRSWWNGSRGCTPPHRHRAARPLETEISQSALAEPVAGGDTGRPGRGAVLAGDRQLLSRRRLRPDLALREEAHQPLRHVVLPAL